MVASQDRVAFRVPYSRLAEGDKARRTACVRKSGRNGIQCSRCLFASTALDIVDDAVPCRAWAFFPKEEVTYKKMEPIFTSSSIYKTLLIESSI